MKKVTYNISPASSTEFLKTPRSTSQSIYIGAALDGGGGLDENPLG